MTKIKDKIKDPIYGKFSLKSSKVKVENLDPKLFEYLNSLPEHLQEKIFITSGNDQKHSKGSRHYKNKAVDLRFDNSVFEYIKQDPDRLASGLTLIDPNHGSAKHIHLSTGEGSESEKDVWMNPNSEKAKTFVSQWSQKPLEDKIYDRLTRHHNYPPHIAAGIVGNLKKESGENLNVDIISKFKGEGSFGLAQWNPSEKAGNRLGGLKNFAKERGTAITDWKTQVDFIDYEIDNIPYLGKEELSKTTTPEEAALVFGQKYERPHKDYAGYEDRQKYATELYNKYMSDEYSLYPNVQVDTPYPSKEVSTPERKEVIAESTGVNTKEIEKAFRLYKQQKEQKQNDFLTAVKNLKQQVQPQQQELPQQNQKVNPNLYQIDHGVESFRDGGQYKDNCGGPGQPPCVERPMKLENTANTFSNMTSNVSKYFFDTEEKSLKESPYKPSISMEENVRYYQRPGMREDVYRDLTSQRVKKDYNHNGSFSDIYKGLKSNGKDRNHNADNAFPKNKAGYKGQYNKGHGSIVGEFNLGRYVTDAGEDEKGRYISFVDKYDWNGLKTENAINFYDRIYENEWEDMDKQKKKKLDTHLIELKKFDKKSNKKRSYNYFKK